MENIDPEKMMPMIFMGILILSMFGFLLLLLRTSAKASAKLAEILKIYAEKGEEPPQSVIDALTTAMTGFAPKPKGPPQPETRGRHFSTFASCSVFAIGAAGIAWWRAPGPGEEPGAFMILAIVVALIFAAGAVSHLVTAFHIRDGQ